MKYLYFFQFIILFLLLISEVSIKQKHDNLKKLSIFILICFLSLIVSYTYQSVDQETYKLIYIRLENIPESWAIDMFPEFGFQWINYLSNSLGFDFYQFRYFFSFITLFFTFIFAQLLTNKIYTFYYLFYPKYFLFGLMAQVRSGFIYPFVFLSVYLSSRGKVKEIFILSLFLSQFHLSSLLLNIIPFFNKLKFKPMYALLAIPASLVFYYLISGSVISNLNNIGIRQASYFMIDDELNKSIFSIEILKRFYVCLLVFVLYKFERIETDTEDLICKLVVFGIFIYYCFFDAKFISDRVPAIFSTLEPFVFIYCYKLTSGIYSKVFITAMILLYGFVDFISRIYLSSAPLHIDIFTRG